MKKTKSQPKYRILKKSWRNDHTGEIKATYYLQEFRSSFLSHPYKCWKNMTTLESGFGDCYYADIAYSNETDAIAYLKNLCKEIPGDIVVATAPPFKKIWK